MKQSLCGTDCQTCSFQAECKGCPCPFGVDCLVAKHVKQGDYTVYKQHIIDEINALGLFTVKELYELRGSYVNLNYPVDSGTVTFLDPNKIYLGAQVDGQNDRCYGVVSDGTFLLVCSYGENGSEPKLIHYQLLSKKDEL